jgi:thiol:disulfide interchange protein
VNEKGALSDPAVAESFRKAGIQVMVGDWTRPDPVIARFLEQKGRAGIPLYLFYGADGSERELPQILTVAALTGLASKGSPSGA